MIKYYYLLVIKQGTLIRILQNEYEELRCLLLFPPVLLQFTS